MKPKTQERGQALVIIALAVVGLFGFSGLAIDGSRVFSDRRNAQNAADTAALAAALAYVREDDYQAAAVSRAASNGYADDANSSVEVHLCSESGLTPPCEGLPGGANPAEYIQVKIVSTIPATFARIVGRTHFTNVLTAIARTQGAIPSPLVNGNALAALAPDEPDAIFGNGNVFLDVNNSGIFSNSNVTDNSPPCQSGAMSTVGNGEYEVDTSIQVVGTFCPGFNTTYDAGAVTSASQMPYPPEITIPIPSISCSGTGTSTTSVIAGEQTVTYFPGNYTGINLTHTGNVHFSPGNYCFNGNVSFTGPDIIANDVNFKVTSGEFKITGNGTFTCNDVLVHIDGGSGMRFNGGGGNYCNNVTFVASTGNVTWNGNVTNRLYAPTGGDYEGVLIYLPYGNNSPLSITGVAGNELTGSIIAVSSEIAVGGNSWTTGLNSQIIGYTIELLGNTNMTINYVPEDQYIQLDPSAIQLTT